MPASPDPLTDLVVALAARSSWAMSRRQVSICLGVSEGALCRWLAHGPTHRNPSARNVAALQALLAKLEAGR